MLRRALLLACLAAGLAACGNVSENRTSPADARKRDRQLDALERRLARGERRALAARPAAALFDDFNRFAARLKGTVGLTLGRPGSGGDLTKLGDLNSGSAWSTIEVPIAMRVLEKPDSAALRPQIASAITTGDNEAAEKLFRSLGSDDAAAASVTGLLRKAGDYATYVSPVGRGSFSPYGQTQWSLSSQHRFMAALAGGCFGKAADREYVLGLMGPDTGETWGLGAAESPARWKGGWGPNAQRKHLARQMGVVDTPRGKLVVTVAAVGADGTLASAKTLIDRLAVWAMEKGAVAAGRGRC